MARERGVGIMARSVLMRGILTDAEFEFHEKLESIETHRQRYKELLSRRIPSLSDLAARFVLSFEEVSSVLVGIDKDEFLESAVALADGNYLEGELLEKARQLAYPEPEFLDLSVWDRNGWLK
jgi:aryl-alcohol dehydrogenase-like predicted oxidoreductase